MLKLRLQRNSVIDKRRLEKIKMKKLMIAIAAFASLTGSAYAKNPLAGQYTVTHTESNFRYHLTIESNGELKFDIRDARCWGKAQMINNVLVAAMKYPGTQSYLYQVDLRNVQSTDQFVAPVISEAFGNSAKATFVRSLYTAGE